MQYKIDNLPVEVEMSTGKKAMYTGGVLIEGTENGGVRLEINGVSAICLDSEKAVRLARILTELANTVVLPPDVEAFIRENGETTVKYHCADGWPPVNDPALTEEAICLPFAYKKLLTGPPGKYERVDLRAPEVPEWEWEGLQKFKIPGK